MEEESKHSMEVKLKLKMIDENKCLMYAVDEKRPLADMIVYQAVIDCSRPYRITTEDLEEIKRLVERYSGKNER
jgi:CO dehydrogenase/acetyl-CoA synthase gamma subunit (corrinoid Fe-S protein)